MAIAFRSAGARLKADIGVSGPSQSVALPSGHTSGDYLLLFVLTDDETNLASDPPGWSRLTFLHPGTSTRIPYAAPPRVKVYTRVDSGSLGSSVPLVFNDSSPWPEGSPWAVAFIAAYSGVNVSSPIEQAWANVTADPYTSITSPVVSAAAAGDWLLTFRGSSAYAATTFTDSVAGDVKRVEDSGYDELSLVLFDSGAALAAGAQTARTITSSQVSDYGTDQLIILLRPPTGASNVLAAPSGTSAAVTAYSPAVVTEDGPWALCGEDTPEYAFTVDWSGDGSFTGASADVTADIVSDISVTYGRDQERQLNPGATGSAAFTLNNTARTYSPENTSSPLYGDLDPARSMRARVTWDGQTYPLFTGRIDDYTVKADFGDRTVDLSFLDGMNDLAGVTLSTGVYASLRTGDLVNVILDEAGWTGGRDIDPGATLVKYWWADGTDALSAINDLVKSEGPPAVAYVGPDNTFVFRDRHHRMLRQNSLTAQATFHAGALGECTDEGVPPGALSLARPFTYAHGWRDIINSVSFDVPDRAPSADLVSVWQDTTTYTLALGQSLDLTVSSSDPFVNALTPVPGTDIVYTGTGVLGVLLSRTSGASAKLTLQAIGGQVTITSVQVRAQLISVLKTSRVSMKDPGSVTLHGERTYPNDAPWAGSEDAEAIAETVLLHYAQRRPTVQVRLVSSDPAHFAQVLSRTVSDRVRIVNEEMRLDNDFFVERVTHTVQRTGTAGRPPVHAVVLGCEKDLDAVANPFMFDVRGAGFDQGVFDPLAADDPAQVFLFDDPVQGVFDFGEYGT